MSKPYNILFRLHVFLLLMTCLSGWLSVYFLKDLWGYSDSELATPLNISVFCLGLYFLSLRIAYLFISRVRSKAIRLSYTFSSGSKVICLGMYVLAVTASSYFSLRNFGYADIEGSGALPGGTILSFLLTWVPSIFMLEKSRLGTILALVSAVVFSLALVRFNIVILVIIYLAAYRDELNLSRLAKIGLPMLTLIVIISIFRVDSDSESSETGNILLAKVASNLGSEWRDGIFGLVRLPRADFDEIRDYHLESLIFPAIPFVNYLPGMEPQKLVEKQIYHLYVTESGLDKFGVTGIRVGMLWEMYYLYSYFGIVTLGILNGLFLSTFNSLRKYDALNFARIMLPVATIYGLVGQTSMFFGVFFQYILFSIIAVFGLKFLAKLGLSKK